MATLNENLECVIFNENLVDPRALPCGHSYCGPPRSCLSALKNDFGRMRCAVCRIDHKLKPDDIKPLYGIRDYIHENVRKKVKTIFLPCSVHENKECIFWCNTCGNMICDQCFDDEHDDHSVRKLKKHLIKTVEENLGKSLKEGIVQYRENLHDIFQCRKSELEKLKLHVAEIEEEMENVETQIKLLDNYTEISGSGSNDSGQETFLLHCLSKLDLKNMNLPCHVASTTKAQEIISNRIESGTQIVEKHERVSKSPKLAEEIMRITRSTQAELSDSHSNSVAVHNEVLSTSRISAEGTTDLSSSVGSEIKSLGVSLPSPSESLETSREQLSECPCIFKHKPGPPLNFPFILLAKFSVRQRNPLNLQTSDVLIVCPLQFQIKVEFVEGKFQRNGKILRFEINCHHAESKDDELLPAATFQYGLALNNNGVKPVKMKKGSWVYPKNKHLYWDTITYSEILNPQNGWISDHDEVVIVLELKL